jgi:hypothetical protein
MPPGYAPVPTGKWQLPYFGLEGLPFGRKLPKALDGLYELDGHGVRARQEVGLSAILERARWAASRAAPPTLGRVFRVDVAVGTRAL